MSKTIDHTDSAVPFKERLARGYKLVIIDEENLSQSASYKGTLLKYLTWIGLILLATVLLTVALIAFTPVRRLVPGYGDIEENQKYIELKKKIAELEAGVEVQQTYIDGLQQMFSGELDRTTLPETMTEAQVQYSAPAVKKEIVTETDRKTSQVTAGLTATYFSTPLKGSISAPYDAKTAHYGVDILAAKGTAIKSVAPGVVINSDWSLDSGNTISIQHDNNTISVYKHNSSLLKNTGDFVKAGEAIAIIGNTGTLSDGPHLHLELWYAGSPVNPENYITF